MSITTLKRKFKDVIRNLRKKSRNAYLSTWNANTTAPNQDGYVRFDYASNIAIGTPSYGEKPADGGDKREVKKPVEVVESIMVEQPVIDVIDLDKKIKVVKNRMRVLEKQSVILTDEAEALGYLQNRKKYKKVAHLFRWKVTTDEKINELLSKYKLQRVSFVGYAKNVPNEALDEIEQFTKAFEEITDEGHPTLSLICDQGGPETKKDPILLAKSPFGRWYYVLGAWDKEVEYVDDLIYHGK